ncbi:MAG: TVP38/TMEM64 family protein [Spirochaetales bacterium]|nr:TVP38/TMEM64 family protein [Spirochaetales bacterium]
MSSVVLKRVVILGLLGAALVAGFFFDLPGLVIQGLEYIGGLGWTGRLLFILLYILATVAFLPGSVITLAGGFLFGLGWGTVFVSAGSTIGAALAFLLGRSLLREWIQKKIAGNAQFEAIDRAVASEGWKIVLLTRLSPIFPFNLQNYAYGATQIRLIPYVLASWIGMIPGTIMFVYFGSLAGDVTQLAAGSPDTGGAPVWIQPTINGLGLVATIGVTLVITRIARRALARHLGTGQEPQA